MTRNDPIILMANYNILMMCLCFLSSFSYNKREFDFSTLKEYNDYLEQVEDIGEIGTSLIYSYSYDTFVF